MLSSVLLSFSCPRQFILINYEKNDYKKYIYILKKYYTPMIKHLKILYLG